MHERDLFIAALEIDDESARQVYLDESCAGDPILRARVERLLSRAGEEGDFLEQPAADLCSDMDADFLAEPSEPQPDNSDPPTMLGKEDDTGQTVLLNQARSATAESNSKVMAASQSATTSASSLFGTLFGRYRVERVLGSGGMGVVYLAEHLRLGRHVALKIPKFDADDKFRLGDRFRREARTMASVLHRNLCPIFDVDEQDGTPAYMSPEQAEGDPGRVGAASDIYSLGTILFELLTGRPIHTGGVTRVLFKLAHEAPTRPSQIRDNVDPTLEEICWKAISRRPEDRFATAAEFAEALASFLDDRTSGISDRIVVAPTLAPSSSRVVVSDHTEVLPQDTGADTIAYVKPQASQRSKSRLVLASLLMIGVLGVVWAIVGNRTKPTPEDLVQKGTDEQIVPSDTSPIDKLVPDKMPPSAIVPFDSQKALAHQQALATQLDVPIALNPADSGLTIHDSQWKLIQVLRPGGKVYSTRFDRGGRLYFSMPERPDDKSPTPGLYRAQPKGPHQALSQNSD